MGARSRSLSGTAARLRTSNRSSSIAAVGCGLAAALESSDLAIAEFDAAAADRRPEVSYRPRWCLNYLRGPLTREQIGRLMADRKSATPTTAAAPVAAKGTPTGTPPLLPPDVLPAYVPVGRKTPRNAKIVYRPAVVGRARLHYVDAKASIDAWQKIVRLAASPTNSLPTSGKTPRSARLMISKRNPPPPPKPPIPRSLSS